MTTSHTTSKSDGAVYLPGDDVRRRYGSITEQTLWRWRHDEDLKFPQPKLIRGRLFWWLPDLVAWEEQQTAAKGPTPANRRIVVAA